MEEQAAAQLFYLRSASVGRPTTSVVMMWIRNQSKKQQSNTTDAHQHEGVPDVSA
jgi:hypothetical protein